MARIPQVTRTIKATKVIALCLDTEKESTFDSEFIVSGVFKDEKHLMKALNAVASESLTENQKICHIKSKETIETLYGMSEQEFIKYAKVLPARN